MSTHTEIAAALLAQLHVLKGEGTFVTVTDEVKDISQFPTPQQPVLMQYEMDASNDLSETPVKRSTEFWLIIGAQTTKNKGVSGAQRLNPLCDRVEALFPSDPDGPWNTLDGLVLACRVKHVRKDFGDHTTEVQRQHLASIQLEILSLVS